MDDAEINALITKRLNEFSQRQFPIFEDNDLSIIHLIIKYESLLHIVIRLMQKSGMTNDQIQELKDASEKIIKAKYILKIGDSNPNLAAKIGELKFEDL